MLSIAEQRRLPVVLFAEGGGLGAYRPEEVGPLSVQVPNGVVDLPVADEAEAVATARQCLSYFQGKQSSWETPDPRAPRRAMPENRQSGIRSSPGPWSGHVPVQPEAESADHRVGVAAYRMGHHRTPLVLQYALPDVDGFDLGDQHGDPGAGLGGGQLPYV